MTAMTLDGLRILVTGAGRGTGRALALAFAERGAQVLVSARDLDAARRTVELIEECGPGTAQAFAGDLAEPDSVRGLVSEIVAGGIDRLDVLVNNGARYLHGESLDDVDDDAIATTIAGAATGRSCSPSTCCRCFGGRPGPTS
ncbi:MAG: SDR family NAD(P)-dependent oxidoreductase [Nocardioidaceae bacterium]